MLSQSLTPNPLRVALLGTRGIPACYGGFESFAEELSVRLVERGHSVDVFGRKGWIDSDLTEHQGVGIRVLPCIRQKYLETVSHTAVSVVVALFGRYDVVLMCNAANAFLCWIPGLASQKVVLNVDGIERQRSKWSVLGRAFYRFGEFLATQLPDVAVSDAEVIQEYYIREYGASTRLIKYGAPVERLQTTRILEKLGLSEGQYILYVSRLEPENNALLVVKAYLRSRVDVPLVLVGDAPYSDRYIQKVRSWASKGNVIVPGAIYGEHYRELLSHSLCYVQATEVGGTHPALIEAMGSGCIVIGNGTPENCEVIGNAGLTYDFNDEGDLAICLSRIAASPDDFKELRTRAQDRVRSHYNWGQVVKQYEGLFYEIVS